MFLTPSTLDTERPSVARFVGPALSSRYQIKGEAGRGGMGAVYCCLDKRLGRDVAIKVLLPGQSTERFCREARLMAKLNSPYVVGIHDFEPFRNGSAMICMEWISGTDLAKRIREGREGLDEADVLQWMRDTCAGMLAAAEQGVIHRDLKPSNILIDTNGRAKVGDFGLASSTVLADELTRGGTFLGTPLYMAPEQAEDPRGVDTRADIYSFGATYYHAITGSPPFTGETAFSIQYKHKTEPLISPKAKKATISQHISEILEKCLAKSPTERFQTFSDVIPQLANLGAARSPWDIDDDPRLQPHISRYQERRGEYLEQRADVDFDDEYRLPGGRRLRILRGDLVKQSVDVIVSSDDEYLSMGGGVSRGIRRAAGAEVVDETRKFVPVRPGRAVVTSAGRLPARFVFHGVTLGGTQLPSRDLIVEIMRSCFYHADTLHVRSVAFPLLGTGTGGFSKDVCLDTMFRFAVRTLVHQPTSVQEVRLVLFPRKSREMGTLLSAAHEAKSQAVERGPLPKQVSEGPIRSVLNRLRRVVSPGTRGTVDEPPGAVKQGARDKPPARVKIVYPGANSTEQELPLVIGVLGDFSGYVGSRKPLPNRNFIEVNQRNFDSVLAEIAPRLALSKEGTVIDPSSVPENTLSFTTLDDFHPSKLAEAAELVRTLIQRSEECAGKAERELLCQSAAGVLRTLLQSEAFRSLEARWRSLHYLVNAVADCTGVELHVLDISKEELCRDLKHAVELDQSHFHRLLFERYSRLGEAPFAMIVGDYAFCHNPEDVEMLSQISAIAADAHAPFIAAASPRLFGLENFAELTNVRDINRIFQSPEYLAWNAFRDLPDSRYVGLTIPRILLRTPDKDGAVPWIEGPLEDAPLAGSEPAGLWGNVAYAFAAKVGESFQKHGWPAAICGPEDGVLPTFDGRGGDTDAPIPGSVDCIFTDRFEMALQSAGMIPFLQTRSKTRFFSAPSCYRPPKYNSPELTVDGRTSASMPHVLCTARFAHYVRRIARDHVGRAWDAMKLQAFLNEWLAGYCVSSADGDASRELESVRPLQDGRVEVSDDPSQPGRYVATIYLRPIYQLPALATSTRLVVILA